MLRQVLRSFFTSQARIGPTAPAGSPVRAAGQSQALVQSVYARTMAARSTVCSKASGRIAPRSEIWGQTLWFEQCYQTLSRKEIDNAQLPLARESVTTTITTEIIYDRGTPVRVNGVCVGSKRLVVLGRFLKIARLQDEWYRDVGDPETIIAALRKCDPRRRHLYFLAKAA